MRFNPAYASLIFVILAGCTAMPDPNTVVASGPDPIDMKASIGLPIIRAPFTFQTIPKLGTVTLLAEDKDITEFTRTTVDFSIGVVDPSAYFLERDGVPTLVITAYDTNDIDLTGALGVTLTATFPTVGPGAADTSVIKLFDDSKDDVQTVSQAGFSAFVTSVIPTDNENYSRITGTFGGRVCANDATAMDHCTGLSGSFDTLAQIRF